MRLLAVLPAVLLVAACATDGKPGQHEDRPPLRGCVIQPEICDGIDNDCDHRIDADDPDLEGRLVSYLDTDGDTYGDPSQQVVTRCELPPGYALLGGDCEDTDAAVHPGAVETPYDGIDQDCSGADLNDLDGDGYISSTVGGTDCDDTRADIYPGAPEIPYDGIDEDCSDADLTDVDDDGYAAVEAGGTDCRDTDPAVNPAAEERPYDGIDQDCSGADLVDADGDGYDAAVVDGDDCDDGDATVYPDAPEILADGADQDCDLRVDELRACPDGSGHYTTIQGAILAAPRAGTVELCAGEWDEVLTLTARDLTLVGVGPTPADVVLRHTAASYAEAMIVSGGGGLTLQRMMIDTDGIPLYGSFDPLVVDEVDVSGGRYGISNGARETTITRSRFTGATVWLGGVDEWSPLTATISDNVFDGAWLYLDGSEGGAVSLHHNILVDSRVSLESEAGSVSNNTFIGNTWPSGIYSEGIGCTNYSSYYFTCSGPSNLTLTDNIFAWNGPTGILVEYFVIFATGSHLDQIGDMHPSVSGNVIWGVPGTLFQVDYFDVDAWSSYQDADTYDTSFSGWFAVHSLLIDPAFVPVAGQGTYVPTGAAAAVGAFTGDPWWLDYPWAFP